MKNGKSTKWGKLSALIVAAGRVLLSRECSVSVIVVIPPKGWRHGEVVDVGVHVSEHGSISALHSLYVRAARRLEFIYPDQTFENALSGSGSNS